jgi:antibiotic biosynthesis monooxygenase (ABM) superfamily enzyme
VAAIEEPGAGDDAARAGERVARTDPVTAVFSRRVRPGREAEFEDWAHGVIVAATRWPGHLGASVLHEPDSPWYHLPGPDATPRRPPPRWKMWLVSLMTYVVMPLVTRVLRRWLGRARAS